MVSEFRLGRREIGGPWVADISLRNITERLPSPSWKIAAGTAHPPRPVPQRVWPWSSSESLGMFGGCLSSHRRRSAGGDTVLSLSKKPSEFDLLRARFRCAAAKWQLALEQTSNMGRPGRGEALTDSYNPFGSYPARTGRRPCQSGPPRVGSTDQSLHWHVPTSVVNNQHREVGTR
jgi:hypothetical protein